MPRFPHFSNRINQITGSVFEKYAPKIKAQGESLIKLHIGDTYLPPNYPLPIDSDFLKQRNAFNQYCNTFGLEPLREVLAEKLKTDNELQVTKKNILITSGATNALSLSMMALIEPGDEVIILTPAWPFFFGMVKVAGGIVTEVPFYTELFSQPEMDIVKYVTEFVTERTAAIYLNTPNNPSGKVLNEQQLRQIAELAEKNELWIISDEAYDGLTFDGLPHISIANFKNISERTLSIFTFSKSFMFAGLRLGYVVAEQSVIKNLNKMMVHQIYSPSTIAQYMMVEPVQTRHEWLPGVQRKYESMRDLLMEKLKIKFPKPEGTYFVFFPADQYLKGRDYWQLIEECLDAGVSVAPGDSFGKDFYNYIRLCFTGESPERLEKGIERLHKVFGV